MPMHTNYYKIGVFTFVGFFLFLLGMFFLAFSGTMFKETINCVTFFESSVQGLTVSSAVKFRGFNVGKVTSISLASVKDNSDHPVVKVGFEIDPKTLSGTDDGAHLATNFIIKQTQEGLKIYLTYQGITGLGFLDLDYAKETVIDSQSLAVGQKWAEKRDLHYIPSGPGQIMEISQSITSIVKSLSKVNFSAISDDLGQMVQTLATAATELDTKRLSADLSVTLAEITTAATALASVLAEVGEAVGAAGEKQSISQEIKSTMKQLRITLKRLDQMFNSSQHNLPLTMDNMRVMSENLRELSELLKNQPSQVLFGQPPRPVYPATVGQ